MEGKSVTELSKTLKYVLERQKPQQLNNNVLFEFVNSNRNGVLPQMSRTLERFDEIANVNIAKNNRSAIIVSKGRLSTSNDNSLNINMSNISLRDCQGRKNRKSSSESSSDASFGGSPLKMDCIVDLPSLDSVLTSSNNIKTETHVVGVDLQEARRLISLYSVLSKNLSSETYDTFPSFWVLCNSRKPPPSHSVVLLGAEPFEKSSDMKYTNKSLKLTKVTVATKPVDVVDCHALPFSSNNKFDIVCQAKYDMMESPRQTNETLTVLVEWKNPTRLLERFPGYAKVTVSACISSGYVLSPVHSLYVELMKLKNVISAMDTGDIVWISRDQEVPLIEAVHFLLEHMKLNDDIDVNNDDTLCEPFNESLHQINRQDLDFTDKLWNVLLACCSMSDLIESLRYVFTCLKNGEIQPFLHSRNETTLARLVRDSYRSEMTIPALKGIFPLTILAEIGIEKMQSDYVTFFLSKGLAPLSSFSFYVNKTLNFESKFEMLEKLHYIMEMVSAMNVFLPLDQSLMALVVKQMLQHFETETILEGQTFEFSLPSGSVLSVLSDRMPCIWKAKLDEDLSSKLCLLSTSQPFCHLQETTEVTAKESPEFRKVEKKLYYMVIKQQSIV